MRNAGGMKSMKAARSATKASGKFTKANGNRRKRFGSKTKERMRHMALYQAATVQAAAQENIAAAASLDVDSPMSGELVSLKQLPDELFSSGSMGQGIAVLPKNGAVVAPCDGAVMYNRNFCHLIGLIAGNGIEVLIHIGLETTRRPDNLFRCHVKPDQRVKKGDLLLTANLEAMKKAGQSLYTSVTITTPDRHTRVVPIGRTIRAGERLLTVS